MPVDRLSKLVESGISHANQSVQNASEQYHSRFDKDGIPQLDEVCSGRDLDSLREKLVPLGSVRQIWFEHLVPELQRLEHDRAAAKAEHTRRSAPIKIGCIVFGIASIYFLGLFGPFIAAGIYAFLTRETLATLNQYGYRTKLLLVNSACEVFGFTYHPGENKTKIADGATGFGALFNFSKLLESFKSARNRHADSPTPALEILRKYDLLKKPDQTSFDDGVSGERAGAKFSLVEAHLQEYRGSGKNRRLVTAFQGVLIHIEYPRKFLGTTVISRDRKGKRIARKHKLDIVDIVSKEFEDRFDVCSNDQTEARFLLTPDRLLRLIALDDYFSGRDLQAVFEDGHLTLAISTPDLFEVGDAWNGLVDQSRFAECLHHLQMICDLVDGYLTREWVQGKI